MQHNTGTLVISSRNKLHETGEYVEDIAAPLLQLNYRQTSNIRRTLVDNKLVDHSAVVGASPVGAVLTTSSFWT